MNNNQQEKDISGFEFKKDSNSNDYKFLIQKLKIIKENIDLLEKNFLEQEK